MNDTSNESRDEFNEADSMADTYAALALILVAVSAMIYFVS